MQQITYWFSTLQIILVLFQNAICKEDRIVNGKPAKIENYPYIVNIVYGQRAPFCGGTIISDTHVLTAAHCLSEKNVNHIGVHCGTKDKLGSDGEYFDAEGMILHEGYDKQKIINDIALIKIQGHFQMSSKVKAILIPTMSLAVNTNDMCDIAGWGLTTEGGQQSPILLAAKVPVYDHDSCLKMYGPQFTKTICAGFPNGGTDTCQGDSGGPLVLNDVLIGVVSFGAGCGSKFPGVYTDVRKYFNWINDNTD